MGKRKAPDDGSKITNYERRRLDNIASNALIFKEMGLSSFINASTKDKCKPQLKKKKQSKQQEHQDDVDQVLVVDRVIDITPIAMESHGDLANGKCLSTKDSTSVKQNLPMADLLKLQYQKRSKEDHHTQSQQDQVIVVDQVSDMIPTSKEQSQPALANRKLSTIKESRQSSAQTSSMVDFLKSNSQKHPSKKNPAESQQDQRKQMVIRKLNFTRREEKYQRKERPTICIAPGSLGAYNNMKRVQGNREVNLDELDDPGIDDMCNELASMRNNRVFCQEKDTSNNKGAPCEKDSSNNNGVSCQEEDTFNIQDEVDIDQEVVTENASSVAAPEKKKHRGRSILAHLHRRIAKEHPPILLNDKNQPVGPSKEMVDDLIHFLGTVAKDPILTPLNFITWKHVPTKDRIWEYVTKRFDVPAAGKKFVLKTINDNWKLYKYRLKKATYEAFETMEERLANRPQNIPENQFKELLEFWDFELAKEISKMNRESVKCNLDYHTMGPCSYAMKRIILKKNHPDGKSPSQADLYIESRKRAHGRTYKTDHNPSLQNIEKMKELQSLPDRIGKGDPYYDVITKKEHNGRLRLYGRTVTKTNLKESEANAPFILPDIYMESIKEYLETKITSKILSQLQEANPGINLKIPNLTTTSEDGDPTSESSETEDDCNQDHQQEVMDGNEN